MGWRDLRTRIVGLLDTDDVAAAVEAVRKLPSRHALKALLSCLLHREERIRWHAVSAIGRVVADIAEKDLEAGRIIIRRYMWSLNDESGGIGWGMPEALAEALVCHAGLAAEYCHILVSFMRPDGFFLEYEPLQRGLLWGAGRLASVRPELLRSKHAIRYLLPYLGAKDAMVRGLAVWALGNLRAAEARDALAGLSQDPATMRLYRDNRIIAVSIGELAREGLENMADDRTVAITGRME